MTSGALVAWSPCFPIFDEFCGIMAAMLTCLGYLCLPVALSIGEMWAASEIVTAHWQVPKGAGGAAALPSGG